ncbi:MAG TPA: XdhC family protein [Burkholderiales bacterium]|nr:XdhC family protein [Burkholderiales bacterium]
MRELEVIANEIERLRARGQPAVLATVVGVKGSAYRLPGARMLVTEKEWVAGSISGGCLEGDVVLRSSDVISKKEAAVVTYDTTSDEDILFGIGLGCRGVITVLIEPVPVHPRSPDLMEFIKSSLDRRQTGVVATVVRVEGGLAAKPGSRLTMRANGERATDIGDTALISAITAHIERNPSAENALTPFAVPNGTAEVFIESIRLPRPLIVFGAGHDAMPIVRLAKEIGWRVTVVDHRPAYATTARFPLADEVLLSTREGLPPQMSFDSDTLALIMTHNYLRDLNLLKILLPSPVCYIGLLGPQKRADELLAELKKQGIEVTADALGRLYAPVGLDIGSEGPEGVALSIIAEMQAVIANHAGGHLRERRAPIHSPEAAAQGVRST